MGRPSKYDRRYSQECPRTERNPNCQHLLCHMAEGRSLEAYAYKIGVHRQTLYEWEEEHEEFSDAIKRGRDASLAWWEDLMRTGTAGQLRSVASEDLDRQGRVTRRKYKQAHFHPVGAIFTMKNRFPSLYRDKIVVQPEEPADDLSGMTLAELAAESERLNNEIKRAAKK